MHARASIALLAEVVFGDRLGLTVVWAELQPWIVQSDMRCQIQEPTIVKIVNDTENVAIVQAIVYGSYDDA